MSTKITYTEKEIKAWFEIMKKRYSHSNMEQHLIMVQALMFDAYCEKDNLKKVLDK